MGETKQQLFRGARWFAIATLLSQAIGTGSMIVVARILWPSDFGAYAAGLFVITLSHWITDFGLSAALVQREKVEASHWMSAFWVQATIGAACAGTLLLLAGHVAELFAIPRVETVVLVLSPTIFVHSMVMMPMAQLMRGLRFRAQAALEVLSVCVGGLVAAVLALSGFGLTSLLVAWAAREVVVWAVAWSTTRFVPRPIFSPAAVRTILPYSFPTLGNHLLHYYLIGFETYIISRWLGAATMGLYHRATQLSGTIAAQMARLVHRPTFATLSRVQDDPAMAPRAYLRIQSLLMTVASPAVGGLVLTAPGVILAAYTEKWAGAILILQILAVAGFFLAVSVSTGAVMMARGRPGILFGWNLFSVILLTVLLYFSLPYGIIGISSAVALFRILRAVGSHMIVIRMLSVPVAEIARLSWGPLLCTGAMLAALWPLQGWFDPYTNPWSFLGITVPAGMVLYPVLMFLVRPSQAREFIRALWDLFRPAAGRPEPSPGI